MNIDSYFTSRATVRSFDESRLISDDELRQLIIAASHAPNTGNMQLYSVISTAKGSALHSKLAELHFNQPAAINAPVLLTVCADTNRFAKWCEQRKTQTGLDNVGGRITAFVDAAIFAQQIVTIAEHGGMGCCYLGTATYNAQAIASLLEMPKGVIPVVGIALGWPKFKTEASDRLPVEAILHIDTYKDYSTADIDSAYAEKEALAESARFIAENGLETLAQVYSQVRYPRNLNENLGEQLLKMM